MNEWLQVILAAGSAAVVVGFLVGYFSKGRASAQIAALDAQDRRIKVLEQERSENLQKIAHLEGIVAQLREENQSLRALVMGETVPPAMRAAMQSVAEETATRIITAMSALLKGESK